MFLLTSCDLFSVFLCLRMRYTGLHARRKHKHKHKKKEIFPFLVLAFVLASPALIYTFVSCACVSTCKPA